MKAFAATSPAATSPAATSPRRDKPRRDKPRRGQPRRGEPATYLRCFSRSFARRGTASSTFFFAEPRSFS